MEGRSKAGMRAVIWAGMRAVIWADMRANTGALMDTLPAL
jgi:hypothetical protein